MATISKTRYQDNAPFGGVPYGNTTTLAFQLKTRANGSAIGSDTATGIGNGDVVVIGTLPAGMTLQDAIIKVSVGFTAAVVAKVGFAYEDGVDDAAVPQDDDYFAAAAALNTAGLYRMSTTIAPVKLPKDAKLILTCSGAANAKAAQVDVLIQGELGGPG